MATVPAVLLCRPPGAVGTFLRMVTINDSYTLANYPHVAMAVAVAKAAAQDVDCVVTSHMNGDFLSPSIFTSMDGGRAMAMGLDAAQIEYACLGNHEFDLGLPGLKKALERVKATVINSNSRAPELSHLPRYVTIRVGDRTVLLAGTVLGDPSVYPPSSSPEASDIAEACEEVWDEACAALGAKPDAFVVMTHQLIADDHATAEALGRQPQLRGRLPFFLGGHEHELFVEEVAGTTIVKVGQDAESIGVADVWWDAQGTMRKAVSVFPSACVPPEPEAAAFVRRQDTFLERMMAAPIATLPCRGSSKRVRFEASAIPSFLLGLIRRGMKSAGVEIVLLQAGAFRAGADYEPGVFTMGDLYREFGFPTEQAVIDLPGWVIVDSIDKSRAGAGPRPNFLHVDDGCVLSDEGRLQTVGGTPFDRERMYRIAVYALLLQGLGGIEPLSAYVTAHVRVPSLEQCPPAKEVVLCFCVRQAWRRLLGLQRCNGHTDPGSYAGADAHAISPDELHAAVESAFANIDIDRNDKIDPSELGAWLQKQPDLGISEGLVSRLVSSLDSDRDGCVSRSELAALAH